MLCPIFVPFCTTAVSLGFCVPCLYNSAQQLSYCDVVSHYVMAFCGMLIFIPMLCPISVPLCTAAVLLCCPVPCLYHSVQQLPVRLMVMLYPMSVPFCPTTVLNCDVVFHVCHSVQQLSYCGVVSHISANSVQELLKVMLCPMSVPLSPAAVLLWRCVPLSLPPLPNSCLKVMLCPMSLPLCPTAVSLWRCVPYVCHCDVVLHVCATLSNRVS